jgi:hypothetical protein
VLSLALVFALAAPAMAWTPIIFNPIHVSPMPVWANGFTGSVISAATSGPIKGIRVQVFDSATSDYVAGGFTDSTGHFTIGVGPGTYKIMFSDPSAAYETQVYLNADTLAAGLTKTVTASNWTSLTTTSLQQAVRVEADVTRSGHPLTVLKGIGITLVQKSAGGHLAAFTGTTNSNGVAAFGGLPHDDYQLQAYDPTGRFGTGALPGWSTYYTYLGGTNNVVALDLPLSVAAQDVVVSVPGRKSSSVTKNRNFTVSGTISKRVTSPKTLTIVAIKGSTVKTFTANITALSSSSTYKCKKVKLSKGTWSVWAVFGGNSSLAPTDSGSGKSIKAK